MLAFAFALALNAAAFVLLRALLARRFGAYGGRWTIGLRTRSRLVVRHRLAIAAAGPLGCYLVAGLFLAVGGAMAGKSTFDEASMRVVVSQPSPAYEAGMRNGDRIVSVDGEPSPDWNRLRAQTHAHPDESVVVVVERGGATLTLTPQLGPEAKMGVSPPEERHAYGLTGLLGLLLLEPGRAEAKYLAGAVAWIGKGRPASEATGPVGIVKMGQRLGVSVGATLMFTGLVNACCLWIAVLFATVLLPWPAREAGAVESRTEARR